MTRDGDESDACLISDLHWVSVKVYLKNKNGIICTRKPATVHIDFVYHRDRVLREVSSNGLALQSANELFKSDAGVVLEAVRQNRDALQYASDKLKNNSQFIAQVNSLHRNNEGVFLRKVSKDKAAEEALRNQRLMSNLDYI